MIGIYCITNKINGKKYIGQSVNIESRKRDHFHNHKNKHNDHLKNSFNKYGSENFKFEIIKICHKKYLDRFEKLYIRIYETTNPNKGYNKDSGGNLNKHRSDETKEKISEKMSKIAKGRKNHPSIKYNMWDVNTTYYNKNKMFKNHGGDKPKRCFELKYKGKHIRIGVHFVDFITPMIIGELIAEAI